MFGEQYNISKRDSKFPIKNLESDKPFEGFSDWKEKNSYISTELVQKNSVDVLNITDNLADDEGKFSNFLNEKNVAYLAKIFRKLTNGKKVNGGLYDPKYNSTMGKEAYVDSDFGRVLIEALPIIFHNKIKSGEHTNNLAILQAWAQTEKVLSYEEDRMSNEAHAKESFHASLNDKNISVLEKIYINYLGRQFNQSDAEDLKSFLPEIYKKFKNNQPNIERFSKEVPSKFILSLSPSARRSLLMEKFELFAFSYPEPNWINDGYIEDRFLRAIKKQETNEEYIINDKNWDKYCKDLKENKETPLRPCRQEINPMELNKSDGEFLISDFSSEYDGVYSVSGNLEAFVPKEAIINGGIVKARDFSEVKKEINFYNNQDIASFKVMSSLFFREALEKKCGIDIANLNLRTQYQFLNFISSYSEAKFAELKQFMDRSISPEAKSNRLKSFLCLELDKNLGDKIILLGEKLDPKIADLFFSKVAVINDLAAKEESEIGTLLFANSNRQDFSVLKSELLKKARELVIRFSSVDTNKFNQQESEHIFNELENINTEMILFSSLLKSAKESGQNIPLEMIKDLNLEKRTIDSKTGVGLSESEKEQLIKIVSENYQAIFLQKGKNYNPDAYKRVIDNYTKELENLDGQSVYILKYKNEIVCSSRFKKLSEYEVYGASFNVSKEIQGLSLGINFHNKVLEDVSKHYDIHISTRKDNPANKSYERSGFVITSEYKEEDGVEYYKMIKPSKASFSVEEAA